MGTFLSNITKGSVRLPDADFFLDYFLHTNFDSTHCIIFVSFLQIKNK